MTDDPVDDLSAVLEAERAALAAGAFEDLAELAARKTALLAELDAAPPTRAAGPQLEAVKRDAAHNARLLDAAARGLRAAIDRLAAMQRVATHLDTYTEAGTRADLAPPSPTLEKRA